MWENTTPSTELLVWSFFHHLDAEKKSRMCMNIEDLEDYIVFFFSLFFNNFVNFVFFPLMDGLSVFINFVCNQLCGLVFLLCMLVYSMC